MRVLVTGATGFLGGHLAEQLRGAGHEVVALCREEEPELEARGLGVARGDVLDRESVERAVDRCEGVFHCAGKVSRDPDDTEALQRLHVEGTRNVVAASKAKGVRRFVHASTSGTVAVSEDPKHFATEDDEAPIALISRWPYYRSKLYAERAALEANEPGLFEVISVNPTLLLGPGDQRGSSTEDVRLFLERRIPAVPGGGLSYVDARDAAAAMILAMDRGQPGRRYLVGAKNLTIGAFFACLERISGVRAPILPMPRMPLMARLGAPLLGRALERLGQFPALDPVSLEMAQYFWYLDSTRAETELGFSPRDPMETLADTVRDLYDRGVVIGGDFRSTAARELADEVEAGAPLALGDVPDHVPGAGVERRA
jgi:nucleoside-diphosphate-sugar epimerase